MFFFISIQIDESFKIRDAWVLHPRFPKVAEVPGSPRKSHAQVPAQAQEAFGQAGHRFGHLYTQMVLPMLPRQSEYMNFDFVLGFKGFDFF
jgi:hypothetical protein